MGRAIVEITEGKSTPRNDPPGTERLILSYGASIRPHQCDASKVTLSTAIKYNIFEYSTRLEPLGWNFGNQRHNTAVCQF